MTTSALRVLHVIPSIAPSDGGPAVAIRELTSALATAGAIVTVATTDADGPRHRLDVRLGRGLRVGDVEYWHFARTLPGTWKLSCDLARWLFVNARSFDVVHVHALFSFATIPGCRAARRFGVPYVVRPLGTLDAWSLGQKRWKKTPYLRLIERSHLNGAAAIHATSESEADAVRRLGYGDRVRIIPLGVAQGANVPKRQRATAHGIHLLFLSRLHPKKGIPLLLAAVQRLVCEGLAVRLSIAGDGSPQYRAHLLEMVRVFRLGETVRFLGRVDGQAKEELFASADVFVLPSSQENFGIAVAEALAAGLPVVVSDQVAIAADIREAGAGIVVPLNEDALVAALRTISRDEQMRRSLSLRAAALARERYSWSETARMLMALYREMTAAPQGIS